MRRFGTLILAAALFLGCKDSTSPDGNQGGKSFEVTVTNGTRPTYTWPGGSAHSLSVMRTSDPTVIVWGLVGPAPLTTALTSPVVHGTIPAGGVLPSSTEERVLTAGVEYRVSVTLHDGRTGWTEFTP